MTGTRTLAIVGWLVTTALAAGLIALALFPSSQVLQVVSEYTWLLSQKGQLEGIAEKVPWLTQRHILLGAGVLVVLVNLLVLIGAMSRDKADRLPRKGIGVADKMGETTIEVKALEEYLIVALRGMDGIEPLEMTVDAPANDKKPVRVTVRARVKASKDLPQKVANDIKERVRDTLMEIVPLRTQPRIDARVEILGKTPRSGGSAPDAKTDKKDGDR